MESQESKNTPTNDQPRLSPVRITVTSRRYTKQRQANDQPSSSRFAEARYAEPAERVRLLNEIIGRTSECIIKMLEHLNEGKADKER